MATTMINIEGKSFCPSCKRERSFYFSVKNEETVCYDCGVSKSNKYDSLIKDVLAEKRLMVFFESSEEWVLSDISPDNLGFDFEPENYRVATKEDLDVFKADPSAADIYSILTDGELSYDETYMMLYSLMNNCVEKITSPVVSDIRVLFMYSKILSVADVELIVKLRTIVLTSGEDI